MDWLAQLLGLPRGWHGHIEDTASTSTIAALAAARTLRPGGVVYASEQANFSVEKAARLVGLEFRTVEVDDEFRMRADFPLDDATAVVATVGTTGTTSVDPVPELARRCEEAGVWLHVDAAYAGSAAVCPELRWCLDGVDRADSVVVNPHKWLFTPMDCSALWTRRPEVLHETFALVPDYLAATERGGRPEGLRPCARPPLPRAQALVRAALVRRRGPARADPRARPARAALRVARRGRAGLGGRRAAPVLDRLLPARRRPTTTRSRAPRPRPASCSSPRRGCAGRTIIRLAIGNERTTEEDIRRSWEVLRDDARAVIFDLWETLIDWDREAAARMLAARSPRSSARLRASGGAQSTDAVHRADPRRRSPRSACRTSAIEDVCALRLDYRPPLARAAARRGRDAAPAARARLSRSG